MRLQGMDKATIRSTYRRLWRAAHAAIQNHGPEKIAIRNKLRHAFRTETTLPSPIEIANTERFLWIAGRRRGVENNVVKNLCFVDSKRARKIRFGLLWSKKGNGVGMISMNSGLCRIIGLLIIGVWMG
jgi:hypothetical protein